MNKCCTDPPGSKLVTIYPDRDPNNPVDGVLSPPQSPGGPSNFVPVDPSKLSPNDDDHGQLVCTSN
jgi:hypothetical protein